MASRTDPSARVRRSRGEPRCPFPSSSSAGPDGVRVLEIRNGPNFDMRVLETDMQHYVEKAEALLDAKGRVEA